MCDIESLNMKLLQGKNAIVTGGGRGIGKAVALAFAQHGANVAVVSRSQDELDAAVDEIQSQGVKGLAIVADLGSDQGATETASSFFGTFDRCDILVNNAGMSHWTTMAEWPLEEVKKLFNLNILGTYLMCKEFSSRMVEQGSGKIIMVSSLMGNGSYSAKHVAYCASKAAVTAMGKSLQVEIGKKTQVNILLPGHIRTKMLKDLQAMGYHEGNDMEPEEITPAFVFFASELSNRYFGTVIDLSSIELVIARVRAEIEANGPADIKELVKTMKGKLSSQLYDIFKNTKELVEFMMNYSKQE